MIDFSTSFMALTIACCGLVDPDTALQKSLLLLADCCLMWTVSTVHAHPNMHWCGVPKAVCRAPILDRPWLMMKYCRPMMGYAAVSSA